MNYFEADIEDDIVCLVDLLFRLCTKKRNSKINLEGRGRYFNTSIVLIGRHELVRDFGAFPYINYITRAMQDGITSFFILAKGETNVQIAQSVVAQLSSRNSIQVTNSCIEKLEYENNKLVDAAFVHFISNGIRPLSDHKEPPAVTPPITN
jgi:hypothetical protein